MNLPEFSEGFDTLVSSYRRFKDFDNKEILDSVEFDEYEKSFYLTKAQEELAMSYYDGKNIYGDYFESTEELRRQLESLVKTRVYQSPSEESSSDMVAINTNSHFFELPPDMMHIIMEQVTYNDSRLGCYNRSVAKVQPVRHDEYEKVINNSFRGPTKYKAIRLDAGNHHVEIITKYTISEYLIRYLCRPTPIILENLPNGLTIDGESTAMGCTLNPTLHRIILERAVLMALRAKVTNTDK